MLAFQLFALALASEAVATQVSFNKDVLPISNQYCVMCHIPGAAQAELELYPDAWKSIVGVPSKQSPLLLIEPGAPERSYFYLKCTGEHAEVGGSGVLMPFLQAPLSAAQLETIRLWIEQGAKQD